jgi:ubiquinone/menaquinone biosynthesis C-methylase UbiE
MGVYKKEYFDAYIKRYRENRHDIKRKDLVMSLLEPIIKDGDRILDLGCGVGAYSHDISKKNKNIISLDNSYNALKFGREYYKIRYPIQSTALKLPFKNDSFNIVFMVEVIEHIENQDELFSELNRILRPSGVLLITTSPIKSFVLFPIIQRIRGNKWLHKVITPFDVSGEKHVAIQHPKDIINRLSKQGFKIIEKRYWNAFHMSYFLSKTNLRFMQKIQKFSDIFDSYIKSPSFCNDMLIVARCFKKY